MKNNPLHVFLKAVSDNEFYDTSAIEGNSHRGLKMDVQSILCNIWKAIDRRLAIGKGISSGSHAVSKIFPGRRDPWTKYYFILQLRNL